MESILDSTKKILGIEPEYDVFDLDILTHINTLFNVLEQLGVESAKGFSIMDSSALWSDLLGINDPRLNLIKTYVPLKVREIFDPPTGAGAEASRQLISELEWRINILAEQQSDEKGG